MTEVPESAMEVRVRRALSRRRVRYISNNPICLEQVIPDILLQDRALAIFLDGPPHEGRQERDQELRDKLSRRRGLGVLSIPYKRNSDKEFRRIMAEIEAHLG